MRKQFKCKNCGEEERYEINGSWFYLMNLFFLVTVFIIALECGTALGLMIGESVPGTWKTIAIAVVFMALLWTPALVRRYLPEDYEKSASAEQ
jgi:hypothetical protein